MATHARWMVAALLACTGCDDGPAELTFGEASFDFGTLTADVRAPAVTFCLTNAGSASAALTIAVSAGFPVQADACSGTQLEGGESCAIAVEAAPDGNGPTMGEITVDGDAALLPLNAWILGAGDLRGSPAQLDFGRSVDGSPSQPLQATFTNDGGEPTGQLLLGFDGQDVEAYELADDLCSGQSLAPGARCTVAVQPRATAPVGRKRVSLVASGLPGGVAVITVLGVVAPPGDGALPCGI
jgi:hypothetical protein